MNTTWYCNTYASLLTITVFQYFLEFQYLLADTSAMKCATTSWKIRTF